MIVDSMVEEILQECEELGIITMEHGDRMHYKKYGRILANFG